MEELTLKYGDKCRTISDVKSYVKKKVRVPAGSPVTIVSVSTNMAIIRYKNDSFSTPINNLTADA